MYSNGTVSYDYVNCMAECIVYKSNRLDRVLIYFNNLLLQELLDHFTVYTVKIFDNNAWNLEHMAIVNAR